MVGHAYERIRHMRNFWKPAQFTGKASQPNLMIYGQFIITLGWRTGTQDGRDAKPEQIDLIFLRRTVRSWINRPVWADACLLEWLVAWLAVVRCRTISVVAERFEYYSHKHSLPWIRKLFVFLFTLLAASAITLLVVA
jgi:hypothetical protein